jgi:uncharacterized protein (DUF302 family)
MDDYNRRIVVDLPFAAAVSEANRAIREEGLQPIARIDIRETFWRDLGRNFRQYVLIEAWSPELAFDALQSDLSVGTVLPTVFAVYELADGETVVAAKGPFAAASPTWRSDAPGLAAIADRECARIGRVLGRVDRAAVESAAVAPVGASTRSAR